MGLVYRTTPDDLNIEDESGNVKLRVERDGNVTVDNGGLRVDGGADIRGPVNINYNEAQNLVFEKRTSDPSNAPVGAIWYRTDLDN
jgi:hypothetical protein